MILDLYGNPIILSMLNYRSFVIYHLRALKALDGKSIVSIFRFTFQMIINAFFYFLVIYNVFKFKLGFKLLDCLFMIFC